MTPELAAQSLSDVKFRFRAVRLCNSVRTFCEPTRPQGVPAVWARPPLVLGETPHALTAMTMIGYPEVR